MNQLEFKAALSVSDEGKITGLGWPFGTPDRVGDIIEKGAFSFTGKLPMLFAHNQGETIGVWDSIAETDEGLQVKGRLLVDDVARAREVRALIREEAVTGLSIGFIAKTAKGRAGSRGRTITALDLLEISVVPTPCHPGAQIQTIKELSPVENEATTPELENRITALESNLATITDTVGKVEKAATRIETKLGRPAAANLNNDKDNPPAERKAFQTFLSGGEIDRKALTVAADAPAYVLAPEEVSSEFIRNLVEFSPIRSIADVRTTTSHTILIPKRTGVTNAVWVGETTTRTGSEPTFDQMEVAVKEIATFVDLSLRMLEDSGNVESEVRTALAEDFGSKEAKAFVNGSAAAEPTGFMTAAGIAETLNGHATNLSADALIKLMHALPPVYRNRGSWVMNGTTLATIRTLKDGNGNYLWQPSYQAGQPETLLGRPVVEAIDMPDVASAAFPIVFGDFKAGYRIYDRVSLDILPDLLTQRTAGLARFHARRRVGASVVRPDVFRKLKMATS